jgi:hypothetical protein
VVRAPEEADRFELGLVGELRGTAARYPRDQELRLLIDDLIDVSPRFAEIWQSGTVEPYIANRKVFDHPEIGLFTVDCDVLTVQGSDLRIIVYSAEPGTEAAEKLALLQVIGIQSVA